MSKWVVALGGLALLGTGAAGAKEKLEPRTQAMLACRNVAADAARLACYDQAMTALKQAIDLGDVVMNVVRKPAALDGVVKASGQSGEDRFWVELDSGDRWTLLPTSFRSHPPRVGTRMHVHKALMGDYWISGQGWSESKAQFEGKND